MVLFNLKNMCKISLFLICAFYFHVTHSLNFVEKKYQKPNLQVQTQTGIVQGIRLKSDAKANGHYFAFLGIPYAKPPIGSLRFRAPEWPEPWSGVLDGSREGSGCVEILLRTKSPMNVVGDEDCLFINVFTKNNPRKIKHLRSVLVFIYGGAFMEGNSDTTNYGPDLLVSKDIIFVSMNYRVGPFGFLNTEDLASPGNYGLKDQNLALQWVQKNIKYFGGDPNQVTIFGQSAGAVSVHLHLLSRKSKGLFKRAILDSGSVLCHWGSQKKPRNLAYLLGVANGITNPKNSQELIDKLRKVHIDDFKYSLMAPTISFIGAAPLFGLPYSPSIEPDHEDAFISQDFWYEMMDNGDFNQVPILMGVTANESLFYAGIMDIIQPFLISYDVDLSFATPPAMNISDYGTAVEIGRIIKNHYLGSNGKFANTDKTNLITFTTHDFFTRPIRKTAMLMAKYVPLYFYYFSYEGYLGAYGIHEEAHHPNLRGVAHVEELYYLFNKMGHSSRVETDYFIRNRMLVLWTNFVKYGNPTPERNEILNNQIWPKVNPTDTPKMKYLEINETLTVRDTLNEQAYMIWWEEMFKKYGNRPYRTY